jgi:hypothetical protein
MPYLNNKEMDEIFKKLNIAIDNRTSKKDSKKELIEIRSILGKKCRSKK